MLFEPAESCNMLYAGYPVIDCSMHTIDWVHLLEDTGGEGSQMLCREQLRGCVLRLQRGTLSRSWAAWCERARTKETQRAKVWASVSKLRNHIVARAFAAWKGHTSRYVHLSSNARIPK